MENTNSNVVYESIQTISVTMALPIGSFGVTFWPEGGCGGMVFLLGHEDSGWEVSREEAVRLHSMLTSLGKA